MDINIQSIGSFYSSSSPRWLATGAARASQAATRRLVALGWAQPARPPRAGLSTALPWAVELYVRGTYGGAVELLNVMIVLCRPALAPGVPVIVRVDIILVYGQIYQYRGSMTHVCS